MSARSWVGQALVFAVASALLGCGSEDAASDVTQGGDTATLDTRVEDSAVDATSDTAVDSGLREDADTTESDTTIADTSAVDTSVADTSAVDTSVADTSAVDTTIADTSVADTSVVDTTVADTSVTDTSVADTSGPARPAGQCGDSWDCPGTLICAKTAPGGICNGCNGQQACPSGTWCNEFGACSIDCETAADCPSGMRCHPTQTVCVLKGCSGDGDCEVPYVCDGGYCRRPACGPGGACPAPLGCKDGTCVEDAWLP
jgi:hypothetical protein